MNLNLKRIALSVAIIILGLNFFSAALIFKINSPQNAGKKAVYLDMSVQEKSIQNEILIQETRAELDKMVKTIDELIEREKQLVSDLEYLNQLKEENELKIEGSLPLSSWSDSFIADFPQKEVSKHLTKEGVHPVILRLRINYEREIKKEYWNDVFEYFGGRTPETERFLTEYLMAFNETESGMGFTDSESPLMDTEGPGWGPLQIEAIGEYRSSVVGGIDNDVEVTIHITKNPTTDERLDIEKSVAWASAHIHNLIIKFDGDIYKAAQAYNYGVSGLKTVIGAYGDDWLNHLEEAPRLLGVEKHGDPNYVFKIMKLLK